jgi:hypothetical protein
VPLEQSDCPSQLRLTVTHQQSLVGAHAPTPAAGENEAMNVV